MEDYLPSKTEIANKLQREMENLTILQDCIQRSDLMTQSMLTILNSFENRLSKLEETINPIYQETGNLQRRHENIEKTLSALNHVIGFYHVAEDMEPIIRDGPSSGLDNYLQCMDKLQKAVQYLTVNHNGSTEMSHVISLFDAGKDAMEKEFRNSLSRHGRPVSADTLKQVLTAEDDDIEMEIPLSEHLPETVIAELKQISAWLLGCKSDMFLQDYIMIRSGLLLKSLIGLKDKLKVDCKEPLTAGPTHSPAMVVKQKLRETPVRKPSKRLSFFPKTSSALKKSGNTLEPSGSACHIGSSLMKDEACDIDTDFYICSVQALLKLIKSEAALMQGIVPEKQQRHVFEQLIQSALDQVVKDGEQICQYVKRAMTRHNVAAVILLFPVLHQLRAVKPEFEKTLEGCLAPTRSRIASLISMLDSAGARALEEFVDNIRNDPERQSNMPKDGTVHELTSNTMLFLEQLLDFCDTAGAMLMTQDPTSLPNVQNVERPKLKLAEYITKVLSSLGLNLNNKAEAYNDSAIKAVFLLNNFNYILRSLRRTNLVSIVQLRMPEIEDRYGELLQQQKSSYAQSWSRVLHYISENQKPVSTSGISPDTKLKEKDRNLIKEKFTGFNKEMDEIFRQQKMFAIPDPELRDCLRQDNLTYIMPFYSAFLKRYTNTNFTKNPEKYIRYKEEDVKRFIFGFFDATA